MFKKILCLIIIAILSISLAYSQFDIENENQKDDSMPWISFLFDQWMNYTTFNFEIYYYDENSASEIITNIDAAYNNILEDLGYDFYWPKRRIKIYVYQNSREYHLKTGMSQWAGGHSDFLKNGIYTYTQKDLMKRVIVHELTHIILDGYMGYPRSQNVSWLHEGLAVYEEKRYINKPWNFKNLRKWEKQGKLPPLRKAFRTHVGYEKDEKSVGIWYTQMASVVAYMLTLGKDGFKMFSENLKRYKNITEALKATYPWNFQTINELDKNWRKWLRKQKYFKFSQASA